MGISISVSDHVSFTGITGGSIRPRKMSRLEKSWFLVISINNDLRRSVRPGARTSKFALLPFVDMSLMSSPYKILYLSIINIFYDRMLFNQWPLNKQ